MSQRIVISIEVPDGVSVQVANSGVPVSVAAPERPVAPTNGGQTPECPKHGIDKVKPKFGGFYCTAADDSGPKGYCVWKS